MVAGLSKRLLQGLESGRAIKPARRGHALQRFQVELGIAHGTGCGQTVIQQGATHTLAAGRGPQVHLAQLGRFAIAACQRCHACAAQQLPIPLGNKVGMAWSR